VIAGDGPASYVKKLRNQAKAKQLDDIIWTGIVRGQDWLDCYGSADLFLFPSVTETQGLVVLESLAAGVPVVTVEAMGPALTMQGEKGGLFADNNPEHFADQAQRLLHDAALYETKKNEAIELALSFSIENRTRELAAVYEKVIQEDARDRNVPLLDTPG